MLTDFKLLNVGKCDATIETFKDGQFCIERNILRIFTFDSILNIDMNNINFIYISRERKE
jgi:hypothetical protein